MNSAIILRHADGREQSLTPGSFPATFLAYWWLTDDRAARGRITLDDVLRDMDCIASEEPDPDRNDPRMAPDLDGYEFAK
jgi:hypothetical protein